MVEHKKIASAMIVGGGVTGIQAALDLADAGYFVYLIEKSGAIGGAMAQLDKTFPTNDCSMCIIAPKLVECGRHLNIRIMTLSEVAGITGSAGDFTVTVKERPRYVDVDRCIACGLCAEKCPKKTWDEYNAGTGKRKAIFLKYPQAVPLKYQIDPESCLQLKKPGSCGLCEKVCETGAINFADTARIHSFSVGARCWRPDSRPSIPRRPVSGDSANSPMSLPRCSWRGICRQPVPPRDTWPGPRTANRSGR